jgi:hypothetical protein
MAALADSIIFDTIEDDFGTTNPGGESGWNIGSYSIGQRSPLNFKGFFYQETGGSSPSIVEDIRVYPRVPRERVSP